MIACPRCGHDNRDDARFCDACGGPVGATAAARQVRKTVTILFADVAGSTTLGESVDPEVLRSVLDRYFEAARAAVERHGGTVEKFIGDAVMAVFGIPHVHEDDPLRAVRAAGELHEALAELNDALQREHGLKLVVRIGVNTGEVIAGDPSQGQRFATGDAVNVAQRLEAAAEPETVVLGDSTYDAVRDAVVAEPLEQLSLKGKAAPVRAWRLVEVLPDVPAFQRPVTTPFVGRKDELTRLLQSFARAVAERSCRLCTVVGPPGIGKSRLIRELLGAVADEARVVVGRVLPYGEGITFWPLAEIVRQLAAHEDEERALGRLLADDEDADLVVHRVLGAVGLGGTPGPPEETFWAFRRLFEATAHRQPLIVVVDDLHWAEEMLLDLLEYVAGFSTDAPILLVCSARAELFEARSEWAAPRENAELLRLSPLSDDEARSLVNELSVRPGADTSRIAEVAEGNPLFLEQLLALHAKDNRGADEVVLPTTIQGLLAARIDRLEPDERAVLETASVEGRLFHRGAVAELLPAGARARLAAHLLALVRKEFVRPDRAEFRGDDGFRFGHILIRDAAYASLPKQRRAELHERYAGWLEAKLGGRSGEYEEILGYHLEHSFRYFRELGRGNEAAALGTRAAERLASAGERALARGDMPAAATLLERAVDALPADHPARPDIVRSLGTARYGGGDLDGAERAFVEAIETAESAGDKRAAARARVEHAPLLTATSSTLSPEAMRATADEAIAILEPLGDDVGLADAWLAVAISSMWLLEWTRSEDGAEHALVHARRSCGARREADALFWIGAAVWMGPRPAPEGIARLELMRSEAPGPLFEAHALLGLGVLRAMTGEIELGRALSARAIEIYRELGMALVAAACVNTTAQLELVAGDAVAAEALARRGYEELEQMGARGYLSTTVALLARALALQERYDEGERFVALSEELTGADDRIDEIVCSGTRARIHASRGEHDEALRRGREAVSVAETTDAVELHANALTDLAAALHAAGRPEHEVQALRDALALFDAKGDVVSAARVRDPLAQLTAGRARAS